MNKKEQEKVLSYTTNRIAYYDNLLSRLSNSSSDEFIEEVSAVLGSLISLQEKLYYYDK